MSPQYFIVKYFKLFSNMDLEIDDVYYFKTKRGSAPSSGRLDLMMALPLCLVKGERGISSRSCPWSRPQAGSAPRRRHPRTGPRDGSWAPGWQRPPKSPARYGAASPRRPPQVPAAPPGRAYQRDTRR